MNTSCKIITAALLLPFAGSSFAQGTPAPKGEPVPVTPPPAAPAAAARPAPTWSDPEFAKIGALVAGTWKTNAPVSQAGGDGAAKTDVVMNIAHVGNSELKDTLYMELARADAPQAPYRQAILQLYKAGGQTRLRTFDILGLNCDRNAFTALWAAPELFPDIKTTNLVATMDIVLTPDGDGFKGKTLHPFTTSKGGAVEATNELTIKPGSFVTVDRGLDASGKVVWGTSESDRYAFSKAASPLKVEKREGGLLVIDFVHPSEGDSIEINDRVTVQYSGWTTDGYMFDSSRSKPQPYTFTAGNLVAGWDQGLVGARKGTWRRLYVPAVLGFGEQGNPRAKIPGNADIIFDVEVLAVEKAQRPLEAPASTDGASADKPAGSQPAQPAEPVQPK